MSVNLKREYLVAAVFGALMGTVAVPNVAVAAFDRPAPMLPAEPVQSAADIAQSGTGGVLLSDNGSPVLTGAWCDPITNVCQAHPWTHNTHHRRTHEQ